MGLKKTCDRIKMECEYCHTILTTNSALRLHQKTAKYCLSIRNTENKHPHICDGCGKQFTLKSTLERHIMTCTEISLEDLVVKLRTENQILQNKLDESLCRERELLKNLMKLADTAVRKPTTTNTTNTTNTINNNLTVFDKTQEDIERIIHEKYDLKYLTQGQRGAAIFTHKHVLDGESDKCLYMVTDKTRGNGKYRISENEVVTDYGMFGITKKVQPGMKSKACDIAVNQLNPISDEQLMSGYNEIVDMEQDNTVFRNCLVKELVE